MKIVLTVTLVLSGLLWSIAPGAVAATSYTFLQFNMCGNSCNAGSTGAPVDAVVSSIVNHSPRQPVAVTLNEVCQSQATALDTRLTAYSVYFYQSSGVTCSNGQAYGNAVAYRNGTATRYGYQLTTPAGLEKRSMACIHLSTPDIAVCATHLTNGTTAAQVSARTSQSQQVATTGGQWASSVATFVGGDFNATPTSNELDVLYRSAYGGGAQGVFNEGEGCCSRSGESTLGDKKFDYGFASTRFGLLGADATSATYSDHDPYWVDLSW